MSVLNVKVLLSGLVVILFGWWWSAAVIPYLFPSLVGTPVAQFYSVIVSLILWLFLFLAFWKHDRSVRASMSGGKR